MPARLVEACVVLLLLSVAHAETWVSARPNAVRAYENQQQLALLRERIARRAFLKDVNGGSDEGGEEAEEDEEGDDGEDTEKLRSEVAALKKELTRKKADKAPEEPAPEAAKEAFAPAKKTAKNLQSPYFGGQIASLTPFGREDVGRELTERSIMESDRMVDQIEKAEVAEEKRAVYRALTRLRGAAINSFDGVAHSQVGNIDEYAATNSFRANHPVKHLAHEESNVEAWAFPDPTQALLEIPDDLGY